MLESQRIDLLVTDVNLPDGDGMSLLPILHLHQPQAQAIVITGQASVDGAIEALREGRAILFPSPSPAATLSSTSWVRRECPKDLRHRVRATAYDDDRVVRHWLVAQAISLLDAVDVIRDGGFIVLSFPGVVWLGF